MNSRKLVALLALSAVAPTLASCAADASEAAPIPTVTVTATPAPAPEPEVFPRSASDSISAFDAWTLCFGTAHGAFGVADEGYWEVQPYDETSWFGEPTLTDNADGSFRVLLRLLPSSGEGYGAEVICDASGTIGEPDVQVFFGAGTG